MKNFYRIYAWKCLMRTGLSELNAAICLARIEAPDAATSKGFKRANEILNEVLPCEHLVPLQGDLVDPINRVLHTPHDVQILDEAYIKSLTKGHQEQMRQILGI